MPMKTHQRTVRIVYSAVFIALQIVLSRFFSINAWNIKVGFGFLPVAMAGILFGPFWGAVVGGLGDFLGATLFPIGPYFPGFTLSLAMTGVVFGFLLNKKYTPFRVFCAVLLDQLILTLLLNSFWISVLYQSPYVPLLLTRVGQCAIMIPVEIALLLGTRSIIFRTKRSGS